MIRLPTPQIPQCGAAKQSWYFYRWEKSQRDHRLIINEISENHLSVQLGRMQRISINELKAWISTYFLCLH